MLQSNLLDVFAYSADVHLRQGKLCELVAPHVQQGGISLAYIMPNLVPPLTTTDAAVQYRETLQALCPETRFLMTLFLSPELTVDEIRKAHKQGIKGVKSYPRGVTTNSGAGVESYDRYYELFEEMERLDMVLNLHGEVPSSAEKVRKRQKSSITYDVGTYIILANTRYTILPSQHRISAC